MALPSFELYGSTIIVLFVCLLYAPLCTFLAYIYYALKINVHVKSYPLAFSILPFGLAYLLGQKHDQYSHWVLISFTFENIIILIYYFYNRFSRKKIKRS